MREGSSGRGPAFGTQAGRETASAAEGAGRKLRMGPQRPAEPCWEAEADGVARPLNGCRRGGSSVPPPRRHLGLWERAAGLGRRVAGALRDRDRLFGQIS